MVEQITDEKLAKWLCFQHFERYKEEGIKRISADYLGVYSNHPTSWMAVMARNKDKSYEEAVEEEKDRTLFRIPAMRKSKFILPQCLAELVFAETHLSIKEHEWRLKDEGLTLRDYKKVLPKLKEITKDKPLKLSEISKKLGLPAKKAGACVRVAGYMGEVVRSPSDNPWSNRWLYRKTPSSFKTGYEEESKIDLQLTIAKKYVENYGPVTYKDLSWWLGVPKRMASYLMDKTGAVRIDDELWISLKKKEELLSGRFETREETIRFLPEWDPLLMGYGPDSRQRKCLGLYDIGAYTSTGNGRAVVFVGEKAAALWKISKDGNKRVITVDISEKFERYKDDIKKEAQNLAEKIGASFLG